MTGLQKTFKAREQQSEGELLSTVAKRPREKRVTAGEQHSERELPEPKHDHRSDKIATVEAVVGSLRIILCGYMDICRIYRCITHYSLDIVTRFCSTLYSQWQYLIYRIQRCAYSGIV